MTTTQKRSSRHWIGRRHEQVAEGDYIIAYRTESGEWDMVERFRAASDADANEYAAASQQNEDWYVLDWQGCNINA